MTVDQMFRHCAWFLISDFPRFVSAVATKAGWKRLRQTLLEAFYSTSSSDSGSPERIAEAKQTDAVLDLVGNSTIMDSVDMLRRMLRRGGRACLAAVAEPVDVLQARDLDLAPRFATDRAA
jgi:hypothetical protein